MDENLRDFFESYVKARSDALVEKERKQIKEKYKQRYYADRKAAQDYGDEYRYDFRLGSYRNRNTSM